MTGLCDLSFKERATFLYAACQSESLDVSFQNFVQLVLKIH